MNMILTYKVYRNRSGREGHPYYGARLTQERADKDVAEMGLQFGGQFYHQKVLMEYDELLQNLVPADRELMLSFRMDQA